MLVYSTVDSGLTITLSWTTRVSRYHRCITNLDFTEARVAVASAGLYATLHLAPDRQPRQHPNAQFFYRPDALPAAQPTASRHWRQHVRHRYAVLKCNYKTTTNLILKRQYILFNSDASRLKCRIQNKTFHLFVTSTVLLRICTHVANMWA